MYNRCAICDFLPTPGNNRAMYYDKKEDYYVCSVCRASIHEAINDFESTDEKDGIDAANDNME